MNKLKFLLPFLLLLAPLGCGDEGRATVDVVKNRISNSIQGFVGKGEIAIQKYKNKIQEVRDNLINVKKLRMKFEGKLRGKKTQLAIAESSEDSSPERISALKTTIQDMESLLEQVRLAETKIGETLKKLVANLDIVKLKVEALEAKRDMLDAMRTVQQYSNTGFEGDINNIGADMESTLGEMQDDIFEIEAELEIEKELAAK
jgi:phage shock protein A